MQRRFIWSVLCDGQLPISTVDATKGYTDLTSWKPIVARNLLAGGYDAGLTHPHYDAEHPDFLRAAEPYGAIDPLRSAHLHRGHAVQPRRRHPVSHRAHVLGREIVAANLAEAIARLDGYLG